MLAFIPALWLLSISLLNALALIAIIGIVAASFQAADCLCCILIQKLIKNNNPFSTIFLVVCMAIDVSRYTMLQCHMVLLNNFT